jgi:biotin/methionine sulfoxide reductase
MAPKIKKPTSSHWGSYYAEIDDNKLIGMRPYQKDKDPSMIANGMIDAIDDDLRIKVPHIRKGYLREIRKELINKKISVTGKRSREKRGLDDFVAVSWDEAIEIASFELSRIDFVFK